MKICFIGHKKHEQTKSSSFFLKEFDEYDIDIFFIDETNFSIFSDIDKETYDLAICWQFDFLAPAFLSLNVPTVVIPMYDGSAGYPDYHWKLMKGARLINFSWWLDQKCKKFNLDTMYAKYFINPENYKQVSYKDGIKAFLWQRRPKEVNWRNVIDTITPERFKILNLHVVPDNPSEDFYLPSKREQEFYNIKTTNWFESKHGLDTILDGSNVFFAPRLAEGIGMSLLEAMARGMLCIVNDMPTHNEYISNWINGVLYYSSSPVLVPTDRAEELGRRARETAFDGYCNWTKLIPIIKDFILSTPKPNVNIPKELDGKSKDLAELFFKENDYVRLLNSL